MNNVQALKDFFKKKCDSLLRDFEPERSLTPIFSLENQDLIPIVKVNNHTILTPHFKHRQPALELPDQSTQSGPSTDTQSCLVRLLRRVRTGSRQLFEDQVFFTFYTLISLFFIFTQLSVDWSSKTLYFGAQSDIIDEKRTGALAIWAKTFYSLSFLLKAVGFCGSQNKSVIFSVLKIEFFFFLSFFSDQTFFLNNLRISLFLIELVNNFSPDLAAYLLGLIKYLFGYVVGFFAFLLFSNFIFTDYQLKIVGSDLAESESTLTRSLAQDLFAAVSEQVHVGVRAHFRRPLAQIRDIPPH